MSDPESLLKKIAEEEARLAVEDSAPTPSKPIPSDWLTSSERIRAASEIPFKVDLVEKKPFPTGAKGPRRK